MAKCLEAPLAKYFNELPRVLEIWTAWALPTAPGRVLAVVIVLFPHNLAFPDHFSAHEKIADEVMAGDVV